MTTKQIKGVYRHGRIELVDKTQLPEGTEVLVAVPIEQNPSKHQMMTFGMFKGPKQTTEEDFKLAEWNGQEETDA